MSSGSSFGALPFGTGEFGTTAAIDSLVVTDSIDVSDDLEVSVPFEVANAVSLSKTLLKVDFTGFVDQGHATNFDTANYTIPGLTILNVDPLGITKSVIIQTSIQSAVNYTVTVNSTAGQVEGVGGDQLDPLHDTAAFEGFAHPATFTATPQSRRKIRLTFSQAMTVDAQFIDPANYLISGFDGSGVSILTIVATGPDTTRAEVTLAQDLVPFAFYTLQIDARVTTQGGDSVFPDRALLQWKEVIPRPIRVAIDGFSGEVTGGLLGTPAGQVFFSPAFGASSPDSVIQLENVSVCSRAYDVYTIPSLPDPVPLFTFPAPGGTSALLGASGGVLRASAARLGLAEMNLSDLEEDTATPVTDEDPEGLLVETIDITKAAFLNDVRWEILAGFGPYPAATIGPFATASNLASIGPGPTVGPFDIATFGPYP